MNSNRYYAVGKVHSAALLFGLVGSLSKLSGASALTVTGGRAVTATLFLSAWALVGGQWPFALMLGSESVWLIAAGGFLGIHWFTFFVSVERGGVTIAALGFACFPAFVALCEVFLDRVAMRPAEWLLISLITIGLALVVPSYEISTATTDGLIYGILSGACFAVMVLINRRKASAWPALQVACGQNFVAAVMTLPPAVHALAGLSISAWCWIIALGVLCTGLAHVLLIGGLGFLNARSGGVILALEPVYAMAFAWIQFGQVPTGRTVTGMIMVVAAVALPECGVWIKRCRSGSRQRP
ncbi:DMT family transporter [Burkholderia cenocepacia]|nr:DMT family transporter [Burkholderia cenocepacia]